MMKISAVNSSFVSKQNKYSPVSRGKEQVLTGKSVLKKAIVPTFALFSAALLTGCGRITNDFKKQVQEKAEKEMIETVSSSFRGDSIDNEAYKDAIEFGKAEQKNINMSALNERQIGVTFGFRAKADTLRRVRMCVSRRRRD